MNIHTFPTDQLAREAGNTLNKKLEELKDVPTLLLLSGGSALSILDFLDPNLATEKLTISVFDDRFASDPKQNNFCLLKETDFFKKNVARGARHIDTSLSSGISLEDFGRQFETNIKNWLHSNPSGAIIATMGVGPDGHTGGMMPYPEDPHRFNELFESEALAVGYNALEKNPFSERITVTMTFIKKYLKSSIVYMSGENKRESLNKIIQGTETLAAAPCGIIKEIPEAQIFTDITL